MKSDRLLLSVIIPVYNVAPWLPACLQSVADQTLSSSCFEVLLIDDASTDGSQEICREFCSRYSNFRCIALPEHTPGTVNIPINIGLEQAQGDYISIIDSDDFIEPDMFTVLLHRAQETQADLIFFSYRIYYEQERRYAPALDQEAWQQWCQAERAGAPLRCLQQKALLPFVYWRKIHRREFMEQFHIRLPEGDFLAADSVFTWYCVIQAQSITTVDSPLYIYRVGRPGQETAIKDSSQLLVAHDFAKCIKNFLLSIHRYEDFKSEFFCFYLNLSRWTLPKLKSCRRAYLQRLQECCREVDWAQLQACRRAGGWSIGTMLQCWFMLRGFWQTGRLAFWCVTRAGRLRNLLKKALLRKNARR